MSSSAASILALVLYALAIAPLAWISISGGNRAWAAGYVGLILALAIYHTGVLQSGSLARTDSPVRVLGAVDDQKCRQVQDLMERSNLRVDRSNGDSPRVVGQGADQIPPEVADILIACTEPQSTERSELGPSGFD